MSAQQSISNVYYNSVVATRNGNVRTVIIDGICYTIHTMYRSFTDTQHPNNGTDFKQYTYYTNTGSSRFYISDGAITKYIARDGYIYETRVGCASDYYPRRMWRTSMKYKNNKGSATIVETTFINVKTISFSNVNIQTYYEYKETYSQRTSYYWN